MRNRSHFFRCDIVRNDTGIAATEFALIAPILVLLFVGVVDVSNMLMADAKLRAVSTSVADLITQDSDGNITNADFNIVNLAAEQIMAPMPLTGGRLRLTVTDYQISAATGNPVSVRWRRFFTPPASPASAGTPACTGTGLPASLKAPTLNDVVRVDATYTWTPRFVWFLGVSRLLKTTSYNMPRYSISLPLDSSLPTGC